MTLSDRLHKMDTVTEERRAAATEAFKERVNSLRPGSFVHKTPEWRKRMQREGLPPKDMTGGPA